MGASAPLGRTEPAKMQRWEKLSMCGRHKALELQTLGGGGTENTKKGWIPEINAHEKEENLI